MRRRKLSVKISDAFARQTLVNQLLTVLLATALPLSVSAKAFDNQERLFHYTHRLWSIEHGLPTNSITSVAETKDGYIWFTTHEGLVQFDGVKFRVFNAMNTPEFTNSFTSNARVDGRGRLWFCIKGQGVAVRENGQFKVFGKKQGPTSHEITSLLVAADDSVWFATDGDGLFAIKDGEFIQKTIYNGLPSNRLTALHQDHQGRLWIGTTANGLAIMEGHNFHIVDKQSGLPGNRVSFIFRDLSDIVWVVTDKGLAPYRDNLASEDMSSGPNGDENFVVPAAVKLSFPSKDITTAAWDARGGLWLGTKGSGIFRKTDGEIQPMRPTDRLLTSAITHIFSDSNGNLWVATDGSGVFFFYRALFETYDQQDGLGSNAVLSLYEDHKGTLWVGTRGGGLDRITGNQITSYTKKTGLPQNHVLSILRDRRGHVYAGTADNGIGILRKGKRFEVFSNILTGTRVSSLLEDHRGIVWAGLSRGLIQINGKETTIFSTADGLPHENVKCLAEDHDGNLWIGTQGGLVIYRNGKFWREFRGHSLPKQAVVWIHIDANNELWMGTYDSGLIHWGPNGIGRVTTRHGLYNNSVFSVLEDRWNNLWMSSSYGIFKIPKEQLRRVTLGLATQVKSQIFGVEEGLGSRECVGGGGNVAGKTSDGRLWFATIAGLAVIDPSKTGRQVAPPPVHIEQIWVDGDELDDTSRLNLSENANRVKIRFSAPYFIAPERLRFKFQLEGFDKNWVHAGAERTAHYTNLPPGKRTFRVFATSEERLWNTKTASLTVNKAAKANRYKWLPWLAGGLIWLIGTIIASLVVFRTYRRIYTRKKTR